MPNSTNRRGFLALGGQALALAAVSACTQGSATRQDENTISLWTSFPSDEERKYHTKNFVDAFNQDHSFKVKLTVKDNANLERLQQTAIASGKGPDIVFTSGPSYALEYIDAGKLAPLDAYAEKYDWSGKLQDWAFESGKVEGKLYSLPNSFETMAMFYNKNTLDKHGWKPPANRSDFEALCADAKGKGLVPLLAGNADWKPATEWYVSIFFRHFAGPEAVYSALKGETPWTDPVFVDAITLLDSYFQKGWFGGDVKTYFTNRFDALNARLVKGEVALDLTGSWALNEMKRFFGTDGAKAEAWDWAPIPALGSDVPEGTYALAVGGTFSVNADSKHKDQAAEYIDWLFSDPKRQGRAVAAVAAQPYPLNYADDDFPADVDPRIKRLYVALTEAKHFGYVTWTFWPPKSDVYIYEQMDRVITGALTPKDYCAGLQKVFSEELKAGKVPPIPKPSSE